MMFAAITDFIGHAGSTFGSLIAADAPEFSTELTSNSGENFANAIRTFVGPILLLIVGLVAISFLFKRQLTQFFQFAALALVVAVLFYVPGVVENLAAWVANLLGGDGSGT